MLRVFIGFDPRQPIAYNVAQFSVIRNASEPVSITPLVLDQLPIERRGLTDFTFSRFLVPYLSGFEGVSVFMDPDMVVGGDIYELDGLVRNGAPVHVVKDQPRFEWPSMMVFNNAKCTDLTPEYVDDESNSLFDFGWADEIGDLPSEWNYCIGYAAQKDAKLYHYTQGIPCWPETADLEPEHWDKEFKMANSTVSWKELMGNSIHAEPVISRMRAKSTPEGRYANAGQR